LRHQRGIKNLQMLTGVKYENISGLAMLKEQDVTEYLEEL
jgi:hypothetical protein